MTDRVRIRQNGYCFTINNYPDFPEKLAACWTALKLNKDVDYIVFGREKAPDTGTPHIQGYLHLVKHKEFGSVVRLFSQFDIKPHMEATKGSPAQNITYCKKGGDWDEFGTPPAQGRRTDVEQTRDMIREYGSIRPVIESGANFQCIKYAQVILPFFEPRRDWKPTVWWFFGPTGTGKTREAMAMCPDKENLWVSAPGGKWFDGYDGHADVVLDDMRVDTFGFSFLLRLLDRYECKVEYKGGSRQFLARRIFITCPMHPLIMGWDHSEDVKQLIRRIDFVESFPARTRETSDENGQLHPWRQDLNGVSTQVAVLAMSQHTEHVPMTTLVAPPGHPTLGTDNTPPLARLTAMAESEFDMALSTMENAQKDMHDDNVGGDGSDDEVNIIRTSAKTWI